MVLVVDDEIHMRGLIARMLELGGYRVLEAASGVKALRLIEEKRPQVVLCDIFMPGINGLEFLNTVKSKPATAEIPVIMVTALAAENAIARAMALGADGYVTKPFGPTKLLNVVDDVRHFYAIEMLLRGFRLGIYEKDLMDDPVDMKEDIEFLVNEVKKLRKERADLWHRLSEHKQGATATTGGQFPLAELSRLTDGIVHDMRSGLGVIHNTLGFLEDDLDNDSHQSDLLKISRSLDFCELVLRNLSALGGQDIFQPKWLSLEAIVREIFFILERKLVDVELVVDVDPTVPEILADEGQMKQVFMNLIKNAGEAMPDGGTLTVRTQREGEMLRVEISDTGCGISPEDQERLFEEFFTTKDRGYGLGLHIVNTIVKRHGGIIAVESEVGQGTTFTLNLLIEAE